MTSLQTDKSLIDKFRTTHSYTTRALSQRNQIAEAPSTKITKIKQVEFPELDDGILAWFRQTRSENLPVDRPLLKAKALELADASGITEFKASEGWLSKFKFGTILFSNQFKEKQGM